MKNGLKGLVLATLTALALVGIPRYATADDIFRGRRWSTTWQLDERVNYSVNERGTQTATNNLILKYADGESLGKLGFVSLPLKYVNSGTESDFGIGDIAIGFGPHGNIGDLHWILYGTLNLPTGESEGKIKLGTGRIDIRVGGAFTYLSPDTRLEADLVAEYGFRGNKDGKETPNEIYVGLVAGGEFAKGFRAVAGLTGLVNEDGGFVFGSRTVVRYTVSPRLHFELIGDYGLKGEKIPKAKSAGLFVRYGF